MERKIIKNSIFICAIFAIAACLICFASCAQTSADGVAAEVNGVKIAEDEVTQEIMSIRESTNLQSDDAWKNYLKKNDITSSKYRTSVLDGLIDDEVYRQKAEELGILASNNDLLKSKVNQVFIHEAPVSKSTYAQLLVSYAEKFNGSKGYYQLMFKRSEENKAKEVLKKIKDGSLAFTQAINQRIDEDMDGVNFNYVVYDCLIKNPDECAPVLASLEPGQISDLVYTKDYIYIFNVVDKITCGVPLNSLEDLSDATQDNLKLYAKEMDAQNVVSEYYKKVKKEFNIVKYAMPKDLPY